MIKDIWKMPYKIIDFLNVLKLNLFWFTMFCITNYSRSYILYLFIFVFNLQLNKDVAERAHLGLTVLELFIGLGFKMAYLHGLTVGVVCWFLFTWTSLWGCLGLVTWSLGSRIKHPKRQEVTWKLVQLFFLSQAIREYSCKGKSVQIYPPSVVGKWIWFCRLTWKLL